MSQLREIRAVTHISEVKQLILADKFIQILISFMQKTTGSPAVLPTSADHLLGDTHMALATDASQAGRRAKQRGFLAPPLQESRTGSPVEAACPSGFLGLLISGTIWFVCPPHISPPTLPF